MASPRGTKDDAPNVLLDAPLVSNRKRSGSGNAVNVPTEARGGCGTPDYMAPEMLEGKGLKSPAIDYWAVGVILFELIVGIPPFNDDTVEKVFQRIKKLQIPWDELATTEDGTSPISPAAKNLIDALLNPDPDKRLGSRSIDDIKSHEFFSDIDWCTLRESKAPIMIKTPQINLAQSSENSKKPGSEFMSPGKQYQELQAPVIQPAKRNSRIEFTRKDILVLENSRASMKKTSDLVSKTARRFSLFPALH